MSESNALFVRGTTVDAARRFAERHKGTPAWDRVLADLGPVERELLEQPIRRWSWYDLATYAGMLDVASRHLSPEDPNRFASDLGHFVLDDGVTTLYRAFFAISTPSFVIKGSAMLWGLFFKGSKLRVIGREKKWVHAAVCEASFCSIPLCVSIGGGMISSLEHAGARDVKLVHHRCRSQGGDRCDFRFEWR